jgi:large subunit ribosomal protein L15
MDGVKLLGKGEIKSKLKLTVYSATEAAIKAVEAAGGSVTVTKKAKVQGRSLRPTSSRRGSP